jgi:hypothetical protein
MLDEVEAKFLISIGIEKGYQNYRFPFHKKMAAKHTTDEELIYSETDETDKDYLSTLVLSREEALVITIAHELRHMWQLLTDPTESEWEWRWDRLTDKQRERLKEHPGISNYDADRYAIRKQREWRKLHNQEPIYQELILSELANK